MSEKNSCEAYQGKFDCTAEQLEEERIDATGI